MGHRSARSAELARGPGGPPSLFLLALEAQRAVLERLALLPASPLLSGASRGDGHAVLVLPGFVAGDFSTRALRNYLRRQGYKAHAWKWGPGVGCQPGMPARLAARVDELCARSGGRVSLLGWSLGGIYAREIAKHRPDVIRQVITVASPFADAGRATDLSPLFALLSRPKGPARKAKAASRKGAALQKGRRSLLVAQLRNPPACRCTAIYSRSDAVADWRACREPLRPNTENIEVIGSHCRVAIDPLVLYAVADRLRQAENSWQPFDRSGWRGHLYR